MSEIKENNIFADLADLDKRAAEMGITTHMMDGTYAMDLTMPTTLRAVEDALGYRLDSFGINNAEHDEMLDDSSILRWCVYLDAVEEIIVSTLEVYEARHIFDPPRWYAVTQPQHRPHSRSTSHHRNVGHNVVPSHMYNLAVAYLHILHAEYEELDY